MMPTFTVVPEKLHGKNCDKEEENEDKVNKSIVDSRLHHWFCILRNSTKYCSCLTFN